MTAFQLVGVVGALQGNEDRLVRMWPVFERNSQWWVAPGDGWTLARGARPMDVSEQDDVQVLAAHPGFMVTEGDVVWVLGSVLRNHCAMVEELSEYADEFDTWTPSQDGFVWRTGRQEQLKRLVIKLNGDALHALNRLIFGHSPVEHRHTYARTCFKVFAATSTYRDRADFLVSCGVFFQWDGNSDQLESTRLLAVAMGVFSDADSFDRAWEKRCHEMMSRMVTTQSSQSAFVSVGVAEMSTASIRTP